ncbi:MAG: glycosyltransferase [Spirochaetaceae bacterium]|nr:glycosyltransferase [Spirochaetaceae bacterium]
MSAGELDRLVDSGVRRAVLRVRPEAVDPAQFVDVGAELPAWAAYRVALARPDGRHEDHTVLGLPGMPAYDVVPVPADGMDETGLADRLRSVHAMVVTDDSDAEVALTLRAMSGAVPVVAVTTGTLADVVADDVTGVLVRRTSDVPLALRSLLSDPLRRQSMGLAAVDRVQARFDTAVVGAALEGALLDVLPRSVAVAS